MYPGSLKRVVRVSGVTACVIAMAFAAPARAATPEQIDAAIKKGVDFLYSTQNEHGNWEKSQAPSANPTSGHSSQFGGETAIAVYALLAAGEKPLDPRIVKATDWLRKAPVVGHYALGVRANVWLLLPKTAANEEAMAKDTKLLIAGAGKAGKGKGFYNYMPPTTGIDLSCSQYGVLGAWAGAQRIEEMKKEYWITVENAWREQQSNDGGWAYQGKDGKQSTTIQMCAAGVATLFITQEFVHSDEGIEGNKGNPVDPYITKGLAYISKNFADLVKAPNPYAMYGIERVGVASGYKYFGDIDWFQAGADAMVRTQSAKGSWNSHGVTPGTAMGILFLSRGRAPVMMNKLQYNISSGKEKGVEGNWNQRPRDAANATRWVGEKIERTLNWQIINLNVANIADLHDSGLLYISGNQALNFTDKEKATLKQYIEEGGIIIGNADVGKEEFKKSFRDLAREFFPEYEFKKLSEMNEHPLMNNQNFKSSTWKKKPLIEAVGNDARLFMILVPNDDFSRFMQKRDYNREEIFQFFANAFLYSTDKTQARYKGQTHVIRADKAITPSNTVKLARLRYAGRWDPEPGGWKRLAAVMHNQDKTKLETTTVELGKDSLDGYKIAHITGTDKFAFTEPQRKAIKDFVAAGGLLVVDAAGGISDFDAAMQTELAKIFPAEAAQIASPMKADHAIYTSDIGGKLEPKYRVFAMQRLGGEATKFRLRGLEIGGKLGVLYSSDDLSVALVGQPVDGIIGLEPETATKLMRRVLMLKTGGKI